MDTQNQNVEPEAEIEQVGYSIPEPKAKFGYSRDSVRHNVEHFSNGSHHKAEAVEKSLRIAEKARLRVLKKR